MILEQLLTPDRKRLMLTKLGQVAVGAICGFTAVHLSGEQTLPNQEPILASVALESAVSIATDAAVIKEASFHVPGMVELPTSLVDPEN